MVEECSRGEVAMQLAPWCEGIVCSFCNASLSLCLFLFFRRCPIPQILFPLRWKSSTRWCTPALQCSSCAFSPSSLPTSCTTGIQTKSFSSLLTLSVESSRFNLFPIILYSFTSLAPFGSHVKAGIPSSTPVFTLPWRQLCLLGASL